MHTIAFTKAICSFFRPKEITLNLSLDKQASQCAPASGDFSDQTPPGQNVKTLVHWLLRLLVLAAFFWLIQKGLEIGIHYMPTTEKRPLCGLSGFLAKKPSTPFPFLGAHVLIAIYAHILLLYFLLRI